jgi:TolB-like protein/Tfp pilus assembly protein PilF
MAIQVVSSVATTCSVCGASLNPRGDCVVCLLRAALEVIEPDIEVDVDLAPASMLMDFGDYELLQQIGRGGQGVVYRARQKSLNRTVALKVIGLGPAAAGATEAHLKRFRREAEAAARLEHPGIVPIHEVGERDGSCYFSMKFVEGGQLDEVVKREPMPIRRAVELIAKVARTVHYAHERGILHRDIKPGNILLDTKGEPHLTDFGLARLLETESSITHTLDVLGTPSYMAPEQAVGNNAAVSSVTDVYGLGAVLYQLLTDHPPFAGGTTYETVRLVLDTEPRHPRAWNSKIDRDLSTICLKCLEKDPKRRYSSALALAEDLERWLKHEPIRAHRSGIFTRSRKWVRRNPSIAVMAALLLVLAVPLSVMIWKSETERLSASNLAAPDKSIAVLPFENLNEQRENAVFADGVQDDILTKLAKIADLKVISRTSVMQYRGARNLRQIGNDLRVSYVLEGSVRRTGTRLHMNAQLIDTRTDTNVWVEQYDRDLNDVFAIQSEIAQKVAEQLHAKISPAEKVAIEKAPTGDLIAFDLYSRAKTLLLPTSPIFTRQDMLQAVDLLNDAVARDPSFLQAYCLLVFAHDRLYFFGLDHTAERLALGEAAVKAALRLQPDSGEAHLARAWHLYYGYLDYDGALAELEVARRTLPNDYSVFDLIGSVIRRQGKFEEALPYQDRAIELAPRTVHVLDNTAATYDALRRYAEAATLRDRALAIAPDDAGIKVRRALLELDWKGDTQPLHQTIDSIRKKNPAAFQSVANSWLICALDERDAAAAANALVALGEDFFAYDAVQFNHTFIEGLLARMTRDESKAGAAFAAARAQQEKLVQAQPSYGPPLCVLGLIDAALGRKEDALREGRRAVELLPIEKDAVDGPAMIEYFAMIAAWVGDKDLAFEQLAKLIRQPSDLSYGDLKLMPWWDPLRGDPRFEKLVEEARHPVVLEQITQSAPEKSIAVLPFENLSEEKANEFFADGVQDEILTDLSRIADLKVISRASVMHYKSGEARNLREIGRQLGVANVVEGSVQRSGNRVRVNAQLVDARTDRHIWAQSYDRDLADVFAIQSEIAKTIADQLQAKLSPREEAAIERPPTSDISVFDLYTHAKNLVFRASTPSGKGNADYLQAIDLLNQAVTRDPSFFDAYCKLAEAHGLLYFVGDDQHTPARLALAEAAVEAASRLRPDSGETHLARAQNLYWCYRDWDGALAELEIARQTLPNDARIFRLLSLVQRRQGHWAESTRNAERSVELNPRDLELLKAVIAANYATHRHYAEQKTALSRALPLEPDDAGTRDIQLMLAGSEFESKADTRPLHQVIDSIRATHPEAIPSVADDSLICALADRDAAAAKEALATIKNRPDNEIVWADVFLSPECMEGLIARMIKDEAGARAAFMKARAKQEKTMQAQPNYAEGFCALGLIDAGLGRKEDALREGRHAVELLPPEKDALHGNVTTLYLAMIAAWVGEKDLACEQLAKIIRRPPAPSYGQLKLLPWWDPLRGDPCFEKLVEEARQPLALK